MGDRTASATGRRRATRSNSRKHQSTDVEAEAPGVSFPAKAAAANPSSVKLRLIDSSRRRISFHRQHVLHLPHAHKNKHITSGYAVHLHPTEALQDAFGFRIYNETQNILSALAGVVFGIWFFFTVWSHTWAPVGQHRPVSYFRPIENMHAWLTGPVHQEWERQIPADVALPLYYYAAICIANALGVTFYHALNTYQPWYHPLSAVDLAVVALGASNLMAVGGLIPAMAVWPAHALPLLQLGWPGATRWTLTVGIVAYCLATSGFILVVRWRMRRESPAWLLAANSLPVFALVADYAFARSGHALSLTVVVLMFGGAALFVSKYPESWFAPATVAVDVSSDGRVTGFSLVGSSHMLWHLAYLCAWVVYGYDALVNAQQMGMTAGSGTAPTNL